ncbi:major facilitator superfamily MFS_1 [Paenibacillus terrae HPL-003]|uniref:Major facilitator superfamily MFS_1 n=1 Tax=Paenibacillus terrae (strain HPL-003) TaxID=985665 RepID=G7VZ66_PAETH|nr:MFS transporter [Paenibacillus terrae]AET59922.1 major facilitator superfamily MFS_1 [Paenibacillus terrae HPL-003]
MNRKAVRAWITYDWANSGYATTILAAVLPIFYSSVAASTLDATTASSYLGYTHAIGMLCVALLSPVLGAVADLTGSKLSFLRIFTGIGIVATLGFSLVGEGDWLLASTLLVLSTIGFAGGNTFYDAMLPDLVPSGKRETVSAKGYAYGYVGGGILLAVNMLMIQKPQWFGLGNTLEGTRLAFVSVAVWWLVFSLPLLLQGRQRHRSGEGERQDQERQTGSLLFQTAYWKAGFRRIQDTMRQIRRFPQLLKLLLSFWFFNDGINTIILMAAIYGTGIGIGTTDLIAALLITQFIGFPCTLLLGKWAERWGSRRMLMFSLGIYMLIVILGFFMTQAVHFYVLAAMVGLVQGSSQSISRSLFSDLMPASRTGEFFGFVNITGKFSSIFGPFIFGLVGQLTGSSRWGILSLFAFFAIGMLMLWTVDIAKGKADALQANLDKG